MASRPCQISARPPEALDPRSPGQTAKLPRPAPLAANPTIPWRKSWCLENETGFGSRIPAKKMLAGGVAALPALNSPVLCRRDPAGLEDVADVDGRGRTWTDVDVEGRRRSATHPRERGETDDPRVSHTSLWWHPRTGKSWPKTSNCWRNGALSTRNAGKAVHV